jgi:hypothetical protein
MTDRRHNPHIKHYPTPEPPQTIEEARELHRKIAEEKKIDVIEKDSKEED